MLKVNLFPDVKRSAYVRIGKTSFAVNDYFRVFRVGSLLFLKIFILPLFCVAIFNVFFVDYRLPPIRRKRFFFNISK